MLSRRRHGTRVLAYFLAELAVVAACFPVGYWIRLKTDPLWGMPVDPIGAYVWLWPLTILVWSAFLWFPYSYDGFRSRSALMHAYTAALQTFPDAWQSCVFCHPEFAHDCSTLPSQRICPALHTGAPGSSR